MCLKNGSVEPARPCCFPVLGQPDFIAMGSSLSVRLVVFGAKSYQNQAKTLALQGIQAKTGAYIADSDATFDIGGGENVSQKWVGSQRSAAGFWCKIVSKPGQNLSATGDSAQNRSFL